MVVVCVCVCVGGWGHHWIPPRWSLTDSHSPNPSWQALGQAHSLHTHTHTNKCVHTHYPHAVSNSLTLLENGHNGVDEAQPQIEVFTLA